MVKSKKILAVILSVVLVLIVGLFRSNIASAAEPVISINSLTSENAIVQIDAKSAPKSLISYFEANGVTVKNNSIIEVLPLIRDTASETVNENNNTQSIAFSITSINGNTVYRDILISFIENDEGKIEAMNLQNLQSKDNIQPNSGTTIEFPPTSWDDRFTIRGTAVYDRYSDGIWSYYYPYASYFVYYKHDPNIDVSYISVKYICDGFVYTYPGFAALGYEDEHVINAYAYNPAESTMYSRTYYYDSGRVLDVSAGSPFVGNFLTFEHTINGLTDGYTVKF